MIEEIIDLIDCPAIEYIAVGNQYFCKVNSCDCTKINTCGYKRLEQENKDLKKQIESQKGLITVGGKQQYEMTKAYDKCKTTLEEIREIAKDIIENDVYENSDVKAEKILAKTNEVLDDRR